MLKATTQRLTGNVLFALNLFTLFILLFDDKLIIPSWLQPMGRMHPMLLHFPIVLLLLATVLEWFRFDERYRSEKLYQQITSFIWLSGVLMAGITVIMGLFLSREAEFRSQSLTWHKWTGAALFFISSFLYTVRHSGTYRPAFARAGMVVIVFVTVVASHLGASVTHGVNFIWEPLVRVEHTRAVPMEEALLFDHVIRPVLENKCISCHNEDKSKGELVLLDSLSISKGGKTGKLIVSGKPEMSLLMKRVHLPLESKKHMPPSGKSQLTEIEIRLLEHWIKGGTMFTRKVVALPVTDSIRILANSFLSGREIEDDYDFDEADEGTIQKLNTNYRIVTPVAKGSPALSVNLYNRELFNAGALADLKEIREQMVSLDLSKLPVKDEDLKQVAPFHNLRRLNLNFTDITGKGLASLAGLKHLKRLNLSGTSVSPEEIRPLLSKLESLTTVAIWDAGLTAEQLEQLKAGYRHITFLTGFVDDGSNPIKLNAPRIRNRNVVFDDSISLELFHPVRGVSIRYTADGSEPDSLQSAVFNERIVLKQTTAIKARAYKAGWISSDVATLNVYRSGIKPDSVYLLSRLSRVHPANGAQTFFDHQLGGFNANSPAWANNWAGFNNTDMKVMMDFAIPKKISSLAVNTLIETETFIFPPESIEIWGGSSRDNLRLITRVKPQQPDSYRKPYIQLNEFTFASQTVSHLMIIARPLSNPPAWHSRKQGRPLLLVDEMLIN